MPMQIAVVGIEVETRFDAAVRGDEAIGQLVVGCPRQRAEVIDFAESPRADKEQPLPEMQRGEQAAGARRAGGFGERQAELGARLAVGHHDRAVLFGELDRDVAAGGSLAGDLPIPAGLGEIAAGQVGVPHALLMVAIEPVVGVAGRRLRSTGCTAFGRCFGFGCAPRGDAVAGLRLVAGFGFSRLVGLVGLAVLSPGLGSVSAAADRDRRFVLGFEQRFELALAMHAGQPHACVRTPCRRGDR